MSELSISVVLTDLYNEINELSIKDYCFFRKKIFEYEENILSLINSEEINKKGKLGNTPIHLLFSIATLQIPKVYYLNEEKKIIDLVCKILKKILECGGNVNIINNNGLNPIHILTQALEERTDNFTLIVLTKILETIQQYHPDEVSILLLVKAISKQPQLISRDIYRGQSNPEINDLVKLNLLPLQTLKALQSWIENILRDWPSEVVTVAYEHRKMINGFVYQTRAIDFKKEIELHILGLEKAIMLPNYINEIVNASHTHKKIFLRALILNEPPLHTLLSSLLTENQLMKFLPNILQKQIELILEEVKQKKSFLNELCAFLSPLTEEEYAIINPIFEKLKDIHYNFQDPFSDKEWQTRVSKIENPQKGMQDIYKLFQPADKLKREPVFQEIKSNFAHSK